LIFEDETLDGDLECDLGWYGPQSNLLRSTWGWGS